MLFIYKLVITYTLLNFVVMNIRIQITASVNNLQSENVIRQECLLLRDPTKLKTVLIKLFVSR